MEVTTGILVVFQFVWNISNLQVAFKLEEDMKKNSWSSVFAAIILFILLGFTYKSTILKNFDKSFFHLMDNIRSKGLDSLCYFLRDFGTSKMYLTFAVIFILLSIFKKKVMNGVYLLVTLLTARVLLSVLKDLFERQRPSSALYFEHGFSFPSGHAMLATSFFLSLSFIVVVLFPNLEKQKHLIKTCAIIMIFLISFSRVYLHVHYFTDILAGWLVGYAWYSISKNIFLFLYRKKQL